MQVDNNESKAELQPDNLGGNTQANGDEQRSLMHYAPAHPACYYCEAVIIPFNQQTPQFPYPQPESHNLTK